MVLRIKYLEYNDIMTEVNQVICLGYFDGLHIAHMKLIHEGKKIAEENGLSLAVFTFSMNIKDYLDQEEYRCLTTIEDKASICKEVGVDYLYVMKVTDKLIHMEPMDFIDRFLTKANTVVVGYDFHFGYHGSGDRIVLRNCEKFKTQVVPEMKYLKLKIGTTRIISALKEGNLDLANYLLGRSYSVKGKVITGRGIAKKIGYPTANIEFAPYIAPKSGVYYTNINFNGNKYFGVTNIGFKPTYSNLPLTLETHVFDLNENLYGREIEIEFIKYLRPEIKFPNEEELTKQIHEDIKEVKKLIKEANHA